MRPLKLIFSAFGSYINETIIDFEQFGKNSIFLICGKTGSGKTMIFDGICYALFGQASADVRSNDMLRSRYANNDIQTFVELNFEYRNNRYIVRRNPEYIRTKKSGQGETKELSKAELHFINSDNKAISGVENVNEAIKNILGFDINQFRQIAMIAQGDFLKILRADTKDRVEIFKKIFNTQIYGDIQEEIKNTYSTLVAEHKQHLEKIFAYISSFKITNKADTYTQWEELISNWSIFKLNEAKDMLLKLIDEQHNQERYLSKQISSNSLKLEDQNKKIGALLKIKTDMANLNVFNNSLSIIAADIAETDKKLNMQLRLVNENENKKQNASNIKAQFVQYDELEHIRLKLSNLMLLKESNTKNISNHEPNIKNLINSIESLKNQLIDLKNIEIVQKNEQYQLDLLKEKIMELKSLEDEYNKFRENKINLNIVKNKLEILINEVKRTKLVYLNSKADFLKNQASILAKELKDNLACPVCGSLNHPNIAKPFNSNISEESLSQLELELNNLEQSEKNFIGEFNKINGEAENQHNYLKPVIIKLFGDISNFKTDSINNLLNVYAKNIKEITNKLKNINILVDKKNKIEEDLPLQEKQLSSLSLQGLELEKQKATIQADIENCSALIAKHTQNLNFLNKTEAENRVKLIENEYNEFEENLDKLKKMKHEKENELNLLQGKVDVLKAQLIGNENFDIDKEINVKNNLKNQIDADLSLNNNLLNAKKQNEQIYGLIIAEESKYLTNDCLLREVNELNNTVNGKISGTKITLEAFAQMKYFDNIIKRANKRLQHMTQCQYELVRSADTKGNSQKGLDLEIIDYYSNNKRSVKSLSGGESFKASLALALGLSDEIQSNVGGIQIDYMFVDEGFGTLDDESLNQAMQTLSKITEGNRTIAIISHVDELKINIDKQIRVSKDAINGSKVEIVL